MDIKLNENAHQILCSRTSNRISPDVGIMRKCWDENPEKWPDMEEVLRLLEAVDTSKVGGMTPEDQAHGCLCFIPTRGP